jgi:methyltransferase
MLSALLLAAVFVPMIIEARVAARHDRALRRVGATEPPGDVYRVMQGAYPACFLAMTIESWVRGTHVSRTVGAGLLLFAVAKALKYWAIAVLGTRWTFRVLVPPGSTRVTAGPYRWLRHPNYVAVMGELIGTVLIAGAPVSGAISVTGFGLLILLRIRVEERALGFASR